MPHVLADGNRPSNKNPVPCVFLPGSRLKEKPLFGTSPLPSKGKTAKELEETGEQRWKPSERWLYITSAPLPLTEAGHIAESGMGQRGTDF